MTPRERSESGFRRICLEADLAQLAGHSRTGEMGVDLVEAFRAQLQADVVDGGAAAGAGEGEGSFERGRGCHAAYMETLRRFS